MFHRHPLEIVMVVMNKIPRRPIQLNRTLVLSLKKQPVTKLRGFGIVRAGTPSDIPGMCTIENKESDLFLRRFNKKDHCVVAMDYNSRIIGYCWFTDKQVHVEELSGFRLDIHPNALYAYDAVIKSEYRTRGIWVLFQKFMIEQARELGRYSIITMVDFNNEASLKAHLRFGYVISRDIISLRIFDKWIYYK